MGLKKHVFTYYARQTLNPLSQIRISSISILPFLVERYGDFLLTGKSFNRRKMSIERGKQQRTRVLSFSCLSLGRQTDKPGD